MIEPTFKVTADHYNSGTVFTGMTVDGEEVTSTKNSFSAAWRELIHTVDETEENFVFELPMDIKEEVETVSHDVLFHTTMHAKALVELAPSLAEEPKSLKEVMEQKEPALNEEHLALADAFYNELRYGLRKQAQKQFKELIAPDYSSKRLDQLNPFQETVDRIHDALIKLDDALLNMPIMDLLSVCNPSIGHRFDLFKYNSVSFGTRLCITMALAYFSSFGAQVALTTEDAKLKIKVRTKN